jgi:2-methylisocitrate lyase-like PEP mutase family enzyme
VGAAHPGGPADRAERLRSLHAPGRPLVLPNAWDAASASAVEAAGFEAVATSSAAVAAGLGFSDAEEAPVREMLAAVGRMARAVAVPLTVDFEAGYGLAPRDIVDALLEAGAVGCNLEDTDHRAGGLVDADRQAERLASVREAASAAGVDLVINARVDVFEQDLPEERRIAEAISRGRRYLSAGADCIYPIMAADERTIGELVTGIPGPLNVYARPGAPSVARLAALGVARVSFGPWIHRLAMRLVANTLERIRAGGDPFVD